MKLVEVLVLIVLISSINPAVLAEQPKERTIEGNTQFLILEGLRRIDESGNDAQES